MYHVTIYQTNTGKWKWKLSYQKNALARSDRGYSKPSHAKRSFKQIFNKVRYNITTPNIEVEPAG